MSVQKLPGLNGLRAIAALLVLFTHVYQIAGDLGDSFAVSFYHKYDHLGTDMVNLFFVISGFIISYVLLREKTKTKSISLRNFYIKRILRIWPIYFLVLGVVTILITYTDVYNYYGAISDKGYLLLFLFIVTLEPFVKGASFSVLPHYWSLSVEEQFYIFWPLIFKKINTGKLIPLLLSGIALLILVRNLFAYLNSSSPIYFKYLMVLNHSMFGSIAIGIIGSLLLFKNKALPGWIYSKWLQFICWAVFIGFIIFPVFIPYVHYEIMACIYLILIINVTANPSTLIRLENKFFNHAGSISYGIYLYHWPLIPLIVLAFKGMGIWAWSANLGQLPLLFCTIVVTYFIASLSFKYFEQYFLKLKPVSRG